MQNLLLLNLLLTLLLLKVWCTPTGTVLCTADGYKDAFGSSTYEVAGRELSSLSPDQEGLEGFLKACSKLTDADVEAGVSDGDHLLRF